MGIVVTELPYLVGPEKVIEKIKDAGAVQEAAGHRRRQGPHRPGARPAAGHRGEERVQPRGRARAAVPAAPRWRTRSGSTPWPWLTGSRAPWACKPSSRSASTSGSTSCVAAPVPPAAAAGPPAPRRGPAHRDPRHRRGHPGHPHLRRRQHRQGAAHGRLRPVRAAGRPTSSTCSCVASPSSPGSSSRPRSPTSSARSRSSRPSSATRSCC